MYAALLCTHKRGVGLAVMPAPQRDEEFEGCAASLFQFAQEQPQQVQLSSTLSTSRIFVSGSFCFATCDGLTAENLAQLYRHVLEILDLEDSAVSTIAVAVGPGSFTGLRLGCAFANGLHFGRKRHLWAVVGIPADQIESGSEELPTQPESFWGIPSRDLDDPFATQVSFGDLYAHLRLWQRGSARLVDVLEPHYGREPTPVLKLKQQEGNSSS
jgi:hypothetical protein